MILGVGTDILNIDRIKSTLKNPEDPFIRKTFTLKEQEEASNRYNRELYYATRFAGKEAVLKALSLDPDIINFSEIEILSKKSGQPYVTLYGRTARYARRNGIKTIMVSISYDTDYVAAFAVAEG